MVIDLILILIVGINSSQNERDDSGNSMGEVEQIPTGTTASSSEIWYRGGDSDLVEGGNTVQLAVGVDPIRVAGSRIFRRVNLWSCPAS